MRSIFAASALLLLGSALAEAQVFYPAAPSPTVIVVRGPHPHWHCKTKFDWQGPKRVCRWGW